MTCKPPCLFLWGLAKGCVCSLSSDHASRITDTGAAARPVPPVQPADGSGPGTAADWPPEAAAGPVAGHSAHHLANSSLPGDSKCQHPLPGQPGHCQYQCQLGKRVQSGCRDLEPSRWNDAILTRPPTPVLICFQLTGLFYTNTVCFLFFMVTFSKQTESLSGEYASRFTLEAF